MNTKTYVGMALAVFVITILVILATGFTQNAKLLEATQNQLMATKQENYELKDIILNNLTNTSTNSPNTIKTTNQPNSSINTTSVNLTKNTTTQTIVKNTTTTPAVAKPKPKPVVTSQS